ncbi:RNA polymerase sigma factor [Streptacidiphilus jiangxiensis]|uniref:RNA polymerase sigma-70 factor, ECF subfamily n=1 Tax=Streptacidiphilus jiangxiensis TaxID=235985 RepID=A0A1H7UA24_STRJI|nr:sigma-70 family RNA polymerase sigma factor [Streptacidiphilus jiangxiensis]SEL93892.1 RNA polymerase sigma-70 factor, ECF subfamily [Streptacidiphilus jiangxiensis]
MSDPHEAGPRAAGAAQAAAAAAGDAYPRIVAALIRVTGDWTLAEDCAQEALVTALDRWPTDGVPANPGGWLMTVARNRALDVLRRAAIERRKLRDLAVQALTAATDDEVERPPGVAVADDRLRLIFTCCHPALALPAQVALTLRVVCAVPTERIAQAFLVSESTMTRRLTRAKTKISAAGIPFRVPSGDALGERLPGVLAVVYLLFTHGYNPDGEPAFADEAIRLARLLASLMPDQDEPRALLALALLQHSRRATRRDAAGELVPLDRQDRTRWDHAAIDEAVALLADLRQDGPYAWQARIAACHATARSVEATDWRRIATCYDRLAALEPSPVVGLNRAVAHGYAHGPASGLELLALARADGALDGYPLALAAEADLTARAGDGTRAAALFREAAAQAGSEVERRALLQRAAEAQSASH